MLRLTLFSMIAMIGVLTFSEAKATDELSRTDFGAVQAEAQQELNEIKRDYQQAVRERLVAEHISADEVAKAIVAKTDSDADLIARLETETASTKVQSLTKLEVSKPWILASGNASLDVYQGEGTSALQANKFLPTQGD